MTQGTIFDIKRFAINDGPGIRTTVFLKGCHLACFWCHNPESRRPDPQLAYYRSKCIGCHQCVGACPNGALQPDGKRVVIDRALCRDCGACSAVCPAEALVMIGRVVTVAEVLPELIADREFYATSGGGITISGGEPLLQPWFTAELAEACRAEGLDVALDTSGYGAPEHLETLAQRCSRALFDVKSLDADRHKAGTGVELAPILANLRLLVALLGAERVVLRHPLIPGFNDRPEDFEALSCLAAELGLGVEVLPYHRLGTGKHEAIGEPAQERNPDPELAKAEAKRLVERLSSSGLTCRVS